MLMPMLSPDSFTAFVRLAIRTSADQPVSDLPLDPIDGEVALNVAAFARMATPLLPESLIQFIAKLMINLIYLLINRNLSYPSIFHTNPVVYCIAGIKVL